MCSVSNSDILLIVNEAASFWPLAAGASGILSPQEFQQRACVAGGSLLATAQPLIVTY